MAIIVGLLVVLLVIVLAGDWLAFRRVRLELERMDGRMASMLGVLLDRQ